ncbi:MAG: ParA family protein [Deltaproteobacteria bacterium]|nr:ParA family protein [Deltaproteobacteria bacterium]
MRILIVDKTAEGQSLVARRIEAFNQSDVEMLDLRVKLALEKDFHSHIRDAEVIILGSGLGEEAAGVARTALSQAPWLHLVMFVSGEAYSGGAFRTAHAAGVRKVLPDSASPLDLLQELVAIYAEFRREGRIREGRVICITHAKGGTGATSVVAAMGEVCSVFGRRTMLWDLDVETRDLCRALTVNGAEAKVVSSWVNGSREISRDSIVDALIPISEHVSVLMPPDNMAESMDLVCHTDGMTICQRILDLARVMHDVILIDCGGRIGPATGALMRAADEVVVVIDDTVLGLTALELFLFYVKALVVGPDRLSFIVNGYSGSLLGVPQIQAELEPAHRLGERPWRLPPVPVDPKASLWPGTGKTLYSLGQKGTRASFEEICTELMMISKQRGGTPGDPRKGSNLLEKLLPRRPGEEGRPGRTS